MEAKGTENMAKVIMVQGTMSNAGKSLLVAGLCRIFRQDGYRVAPFKSQNMALNSYITEDGLEMGRAQVMQAEAAGISPDVCMNPILLKPTNDTGSQVIVNGEVIGNMGAREYFAYKKQLIPDILHAFHRLEEMVDIIVIEGAGSPAEINLKENDIVNMGMAELVDAPVLLIGDIDRGGVFAQLLGTLMLLEPQELSRVKGLIINKFRGDQSLLDSGITMLEEKGGVDVVGVVPYMKLNIEDEDSLTERFDSRKHKRPGSAVNREDPSMSDGIVNVTNQPISGGVTDAGADRKLSTEGACDVDGIHRLATEPGSGLDLAVIRYPRISNFTDFNVFEQVEGVSVRYVTDASQLGTPDLILLPGTKNTIGDMRWMRESGMEQAVKSLAMSVPIFGICGGYQMLGAAITDPENNEDDKRDRENDEDGSMIRGMELLPIQTRITSDKVRRQVSGSLPEIDGIFADLSGKHYEGYEIHMGITDYICDACCDIPVVVQNGNVYGTYIHGFFDEAKIAAGVLKVLAKRRGLRLDLDGLMSYRNIKEAEYDKLADTLREYLDMDAVYSMLREVRYK